MAWTALATLFCAASTSVMPFIFGATLIGTGHALVHVSRQSQVVEIVPDQYRARGLTTLAGIWRIANFVGPVVGALVIHSFGLRAAYVFAAAAMLVGGIALLMARERRSPAHAPQPPRVSPARVIRENRRVLGTLGLAVALTGAVRGARIVALPLWAAHLGLPDGTASAVFAVSAAVDMVLFLPAGLVMDKWGRRWIALPSTLLLGLGLVALPFTAGVATLTVAAVILGLGNGWGSGLLMTLGFDVAPAEGRQVFVGLWMVLQDAGGLVGPAIVSLGALASLPVGILAVGAIGVAATGLLARWIPPWRLSEGAQPQVLD
jgi:MFS family permease